MNATSRLARIRKGEVTVRLEKSGRIVNGLGADTDIIVASAKAYLHALNLIEKPLEKQHPQSRGFDADAITG